MSNNITYLYKITNLNNGKMYIGMSNNPKARKKAHLGGTRQGSKELAKDLPGDFCWDIIDCGTRNYIANREIEEIKSNNTIRPFGYNISTGGEAGNTSEGVDAVKALFSAKEVEDIRHIIHAKIETKVNMAKRLGVCSGTIYDIVNGTTYKNVPGPTEAIGSGRGEDSGASKLKETDIIIIRKKYSEGVHQRELAKLFNVDAKSISSIVRGETWAHVAGPIVKKDKRKSPTIITEVLIDELKTLRVAGLSYQAISSETGLKRHIVSEYCRRLR